METIESTQLRNILLDYYDTPINITLSTPTPLKIVVMGQNKIKPLQPITLISKKWKTT